LGSAKQNFLIAKRQAMPACDDNDDGLNFLSFPRKTFREKLSEKNFPRKTFGTAVVQMESKNGGAV
jgi:hypothetical protein